MKTKLSIICIAMSLMACQPGVNEKAESDLAEMLKKESYFELRNSFEKYQHEISEKLSLEVQAYLLNTFNKNSISNNVIEELLAKHNESLSDSAKAELLMVKSDNYLKLFDYQSALDANNEILKNYADALDSAMIADIKNINNIYSPLIDVPAQKIQINDDNYIPITRDVIGLMNVEVEIKNYKYDFIYDTGAGMSFVKRSYAEQMGFELYETSIDVQSATGIVVKSSLAVIDTLKLGNITVLNSVFLVVEDEMMEFPQVNFFPLAAIGFPIMEEFTEFTITKSDTLIIPKVASSNSLANMRLNGLSPNVNLFNGTDTIELAFDTGATKSHYTSKYYDRYEQEIVENAKYDSVTTSSGGGAKRHEAYLIDSTELFIGNKRAVFNDIYVHVDLNKTFNDVYGNLGQDLIRQFDRMTLNFDDMYLRFE